MHAIVKAYTLSECMDAMATYANAYESAGGKNLIFCEDRLTLIAERALMREMGGTFLSSVSTFARFLSSEEKTLSKQGSVMAVGEVMARLQQEGVLQCFTSVSGIANNAKSIYETAKEQGTKIIPADNNQTVYEKTNILIKNYFLKNKERFRVIKSIRRTKEILSEFLRKWD